MIRCISQHSSVVEGARNGKLLMNQEGNGMGNEPVGADGSAGVMENGRGGVTEGRPGDRMEESIFSWEQGVKVEPWPEPVDGAALLEALTAVLKRYAVLVRFAAETL